MQPSNNERVPNSVIEHVCTGAGAREETKAHMAWTIYFQGKHCQNWNNIWKQNRIRENDRKTYAFPGSKRHRVVETTNSTHAPK